MKSMGIIGFGRFGQLVAAYLKEEFEIVVSDKENKEEQARKAGVRFKSMEEACSQDIVLLCVPISCFKKVIEEITPYLSKGTLLMDTCSVKHYPCSIMAQMPVETLGTHPLFGPDSAAQSLKDSKIALCPLSISPGRLQKIKNYLLKKDLKVIVTSPEEHDRQQARSHLLTHFIGRAMIAMGLGPQVIDTLGYKRLLRILETVQNDTWQLFEDMNTYNPYAQKMREDFLASLHKIQRRIL